MDMGARAGAQLTGIRAGRRASGSVKHSPSRGCFVLGVSPASHCANALQEVQMQNASDRHVVLGATHKAIRATEPQNALLECPSPCVYAIADSAPSPEYRASMLLDQGGCPAPPGSWPWR
jgi:hypothetical protein